MIEVKTIMEIVKPIANMLADAVAAVHLEVTLVVATKFNKPWKINGCYNRYLTGIYLLHVPSSEVANSFIVSVMSSVMYSLTFPVIFPQTTLCTANVHKLSG